MMRRTVFIPRWMDASNLNAQNKNAQLLLRNWPASDWLIKTLSYNAPDEIVYERKDTEIARLWRKHCWMPSLFLRYLQQYDLVFYPGVHAIDAAGLRWRRRLGLRAPVVATLEGLLGDKYRQEEYSEWAGHPVYCQQVAPKVVHRVDEILHAADHIIAISPFLAAMGKRRYGNKFSVLSLGVDTNLFFPAQEKTDGRPIVVSAGRVERHKRPELFLDLAQVHPEADFIWYGEGSMRDSLIEKAESKGVFNIKYPGSKTPQQLAEAFRQAHVFVLPSQSEGVPKVTQEAAACGLPVVLFGFFEAPSVINGKNGFVVWDDAGFFERTRQLICEPKLRLDMGAVSADLAKAWDWRLVSLDWYAEVTAPIR